MPVFRIFEKIFRVLSIEVSRKQPKVQHFRISHNLLGAIQMAGMTPAEKALEIDNDAASKYLAKYERHLGLEKDATAQMLDSAIGKFYEFLQIPAKQNRFLDVVTGVWSILSNTIPLLGGVKMAENVFSLCVKAEEMTTKLAPVMRAGQSISSAVDKISPVAAKAIKGVQTGVQTYSSTKDAIAKMTDVLPEPTKGFANLEIAKQIRLDFINTLYLRMASIDIASNAIHGEFANRVNGFKSNPDATLEALATRLLPIPAELSAAEFDQLEMKILYSLITLYMKKNVAFTRHIMVDNSTGGRIVDREEDYTVDSINSNQMEKFSDWFGSIARRGRYFNIQFMQIPLESDEFFFKVVMKSLNCSVVDSVSHFRSGRGPGEI
jgi:hypothetical protein